MNEVKIKGWVARDSFLDVVSLYSTKPYRNGGIGIWNILSGGCIGLSKDLFPDLKWEDEPLEVEITIKAI